jgi:hypothetical protein
VQNHDRKQIWALKKQNRYEDGNEGKVKMVYKKDEVHDVLKWGGSGRLRNGSESDKKWKKL